MNSNVTTLASLLIACTLLMASAASIKPVAESKLASEAAASATGNRKFMANNEDEDPRAVYSPEVAQILANPRLMQELYEALQYRQQMPYQSEYQQAAEMPINKRAQTFVRFGKRAQTFVRFG